MKRIHLPLKLKLFLPVSLIIIVVVTVLTIYFVYKSISVFNSQIEDNLESSVTTISKMFEREHALKLENVKKNLNITKVALSNSDLIITSEEFKEEFINQNTLEKKETVINKWYLDNVDLYGNANFVDSLTNLLGGTVTIFQKTDVGFVRISTNVLFDKENRAIGTYIPFDSPVSKTVLENEPYYGRAFVVNEWYMTAYHPIIDDNEVVGMFYVGNKEKDLDEIKNILYEIEIGKSGYPFVFDKKGNLIVHQHREGEFWGDSILFQKVSSKKNGLVEYYYDSKKKIAAFQYFDKFEFYVAASVFIDDETKKLRRDTIIGAALTGITSILLLLGFIYYFTTDKIHKFFTELQKSKLKLDTISKELEDSEERYRKLFDSTGDDIFVTDINENIIELNNAACETLGYKRKELLNKKITDIKTDKFKENVSKNREIIFEKGSHSFESEHVTKSGAIIQVEFRSRLVSYGNERFILSVVRNISERVESERKILSAVIRGEERERQRFAAEMHDGLGPLLSAIKLYINELGSLNMPEEERKDLIKYSNELIDEAVNATRTISNNLMPTVIHSYGLIKAVKAFCDKVNKTNKLNINFETENISDRLESNLELIFFRIISELINNTIKHAQAKNVYILLVKYKDRLSLYFKDDGVGFDVNEIINSETKGMGLKNIISRVKSIKGKYSFSSAYNKGFTITIELNI